MSHDDEFHPVADQDAYEARDIPYKALYVVLAIVLGVTVAFAVFVYPLVEGLLTLRDRDIRPVPIEEVELQRPPGPLLQQSPEAEYRAYEERMEERVNSYGWRDRSAGIARIPVDRARDLVLEEGLPEPAQMAPATDTAAAETEEAEGP
jgi:hypothetical protein